MLSIFILCAGNGDRWNDHLGVPKQLISFGGEALIERTARLVIERGQARVWCVTRDLRVSLPKHQKLIVSQTDSLAETILATSGYWCGKNVFLLGDVFYSEDAISLIIGSQRGLAFFGRPWSSSLVCCGHGEMFGLTFGMGSRDVVLKVLAGGLSIKPTGVQANLWNLYQLAGGLPLGSSRYLPQLLAPIDDYTNDIDTPLDYARRKGLYERISLGREHGHSGSSASRPLCQKHDDLRRLNAIF